MPISLLNKLLDFEQRKRIRRGVVTAIASIRRHTTDEDGIVEDSCGVDEGLVGVTPVASGPMGFETTP